MPSKVPSLSPEPPIDAASRRTSGALQELSHDIRSAMSDVLGGIRLVETDRMAPDAQTQIDRVRAAADTLAALVDEALLTAAGETLIRAEFAQVDVEDWVQALDRRWTGRAAERGSRFAIEQLGTLPQRVRVSAITLDRIVGNLIGNALVHSAGGAVGVELSCDDATGFSICVKDQGPGFPARVLATPDRSHASTSGSGLGLHIVRELSLILPATLTLANLTPQGQGCARLVIPSAKVDWIAPGPVPCLPPDLGGLRILVAEDNLTNQTILRQMLEKMNADAVFVADGVAALEALACEAFDIGLIDIEMPRLSGLEVMEKVRAWPNAQAKMPLVAITAYVLRDNREAIYAAGADGIIGKPIASGVELGGTILRHVGRPVATSEMQSALLDTGPVPGMDNGPLDRLLEAAGASGSADFLDRVLEDLTSVQGALKQGVAETNTQEIRAQTHILIAISGALGADRLCQMAEALNVAANSDRHAQMVQIHGHLGPYLAGLLDVIAKRRAALG